MNLHAALPPSPDAPRRAGVTRVHGLARSQGCALPLAGSLALHLLLRPART